VREGEAMERKKSHGSFYCLYLTPLKKKRKKKGVNSRKEGTFSVLEWPRCLFSFPFSARIGSYHQMGTDHPHL
jgi:hypothetical protein